MASPSVTHHHSALPRAEPSVGQQSHHLVAGNASGPCCMCSLYSQQLFTTQRTGRLTYEQLLATLQQSTNQAGLYSRLHTTAGCTATQVWKHMDTRAQQQALARCKSLYTLRGLCRGNLWQCKHAISLPTHVQITQLISYCTKSLSCCAGSATRCTWSMSTCWLQRGQHCCAASTRTNASPLQGK